VKSYDLCQIKAALPEYLERIFTHTEDRIKAACPFHYVPGCLHEATGNRASLYYLNPPF
jgi:hypothetical protein